MTGINAIVCIVTVPLLLDLSLDWLLGVRAPKIDLLPAMLSVFALTLVPTAIGLILRSIYPDIAARAEPSSRRIVSLMLVAVIGATIIAERETIVRYFLDAGLAALLLNLGALVLAATVARAVVRKPERRRTIIIEIGVQNAVLAITIAYSFLQMTPVGVPAGVYGLIALCTTGAYAYFSGRGGHI